MTDQTAGVAFEAYWELGRTPAACEMDAAVALSDWVARLAEPSTRARLLADGPT